MLKIRCGFKRVIVMVINSSGALSKEYFISYLELVMNAKGCTLQQAKDFVFNRIFNNDAKHLGHSSYQAFLLGYENIKRKMES